VAAIRYLRLQRSGSMTSFPGRYAHSASDRAITHRAIGTHPVQPEMGNINRAERRSTSPGRRNGVGSRPS
jgi:hypothetical protein